MLIRSVVMVVILQKQALSFDEISDHFQDIVKIQQVSIIIKIDVLILLLIMSRYLKLSPLSSSLVMYRA